MDYYDYYDVQPALWAGYFVMYLLLSLAFYVYMAICLMKLAQKTNTANPWLAWIPIANIYLMCQIARKPGWWFILFLIPPVNIVVAIIVWMNIAEILNKPNWLGVLMIVPGVNLVIPGYLAFAK